MFRHKLSPIFFGVLFFAVSLGFGHSAFAQQVVPSKDQIEKAVVLEVIDQKQGTIPGTSLASTNQTLLIKILDGPEKDKTLRIDNDYTHLDTGEVLYVVHTVDQLEGRDYYTVSDPYRLPTVLFFVGLFIVIVIFFGGFPGLRGLLALM